MRLSLITVAIGILVFWGYRAQTAEKDCLSLWQQNPVSQSCKAYVSAVAPDQATPMFVDLQNGQCRVMLICENWYGGGVPNLHRDIDKDQLINLHNCGGELQVGPCWADQP